MSAGRIALDCPREGRQQGYTRFSRGSISRRVHLPVASLSHKILSDSVFTRTHAVLQHFLHGESRTPANSSYRRCASIASCFALPPASYRLPLTIHCCVVLLCVHRSTAYAIRYDLKFSLSRLINNTQQEVTNCRRSPNFLSCSEPQTNKRCSIYKKKRH